ncbi:MAG TPA: EAL domain-containing protein [Burkholderiales bacterium]|nr:EAL domain-containing protein [Burkholderiales bacterium]
MTLLVLGILWSGVLHLLDVERSAARREAAVLAREVSETYEAQVVRALREIDQTLKVVKHDFERERNPRVLETLDSHEILPPPMLFDLRIVDQQGNIVASTREGERGNLAEKDYFRAHRDQALSSLWIGQPAQIGNGEEKLHFSRGLRSADGAFLGVVTLSVAAGYFVSGYEEAKLGKEGVLGLVGSDGVFRVRRTGSSVKSGEQIDYAQAVGEADPDDKEVQILQNNWDGVARYTVARQLFEFPLAVFVGVSEAEQSAQVEQSNQRYIAATAVASLVVISLFALLGRMSWQLARSRQRETEATVEHAQRVEYLAFHDALTGLPNRSFFSKLLIQSIAHSQRYERKLAVLFLDLDRFKSINDTLGHEAGDELLREVSRRLQGCLRESDMVARLGGDEFVVLLPELAEDKYAGIVANKILVETARPFVLLGHEFSVTASIGISVFPQDGADEQSLTKNADIAMYHAKDQGKNNYQYFSKALGSDMFGRLALEANLRHALARDEFVLHYQPKRNLRDDRISGVEALLRWRHPQLGLIEPKQFIPLAEESGLIVPIGKWVLRTACAQNMAWQGQGLPPIPIAVNMTARQFFDDNLLNDLHIVLKSTGMPPHLLELEITESLLMQDVNGAMAVLSKLKRAGMRVAVDDFGVGYSSLATLQRFPLDTVKIDRSFIREAAGDENGETLTRAIIAMGRSLSMNIVAQGVETKEQAEYLREHACNEFQGFYFDKPAPADQLEEILRTQS